MRVLFVMLHTVRAVGRCRATVQGRNLWIDHVFYYLFEGKKVVLIILAAPIADYGLDSPVSYS
jgi:hypothetical protein